MQLRPLAVIKLTSQNASLRSHDRPEAGIFKILGSCKLAVGSCKLSVGSCKLSVGSCKLSVGSYKLSVGSCKLAVGCCKLSVGSCKLAVGSCKLSPLAPQKLTGQNASLRSEGRQSLTPLSDGGRADRRTLCRYLVMFGLTEIVTLSFTKPISPTLLQNPQHWCIRLVQFQPQLLLIQREAAPL